MSIGGRPLVRDLPPPGTWLSQVPGRPVRHWNHPLPDEPQKQLEAEEVEALIFSGSIFWAILGGGGGGLSPRTRP